MSFIEKIDDEEFLSLSKIEQKQYVYHFERDLNFSIYTPCGVCFALYDMKTGVLIEMTGNKMAIEHIQLMLKVNLIHGQHGRRLSYPLGLDDLDFINEQFGIVIKKG